jgi:hypothetical protein
VGTDAHLKLEELDLLAKVLQKTKNVQTLRKTLLLSSSQIHCMQRWYLEELHLLISGFILFLLKIIIGGKNMPPADIHITAVDDCPRFCGSNTANLLATFFCKSFRIAFRERWTMKFRPHCIFYELDSCAFGIQLLINQRILKQPVY